MIAEIEWININDGLPVIPKEHYGVSVLVATFDSTFAEVNGGDGWEVYSVLYGSIIGRDGKTIELFKGSNKLYDFMTTYISNNGNDFGPLGDEIKYWAYLPKHP
jgi:hypothetical protein